MSVLAIARISPAMTNRTNTVKEFYLIGSRRENHRYDRRNDRLCKPTVEHRQVGVSTFVLLTSSKPLFPAIELHKKRLCLQRKPTSFSRTWENLNCAPDCFQMREFRATTVARPHYRRTPITAGRERSSLSSPASFSGPASSPFFFSPSFHLFPMPGVRTRLVRRRSSAFLCCLFTHEHRKHTHTRKCTRMRMRKTPSHTGAPPRAVCLLRLREA